MLIVNGSQADRITINAWLKEICSSVYVDTFNGVVSLESESSVDYKSQSVIYLMGGCSALFTLIHSKKKVTINPLPFPSSGLPQDSRRTVGMHGGGLTYYLHSTKENLGGKADSMDSRVFIDLSNNNGESYAHGSPMWLVLAHELAEGHAYHAAKGTLENGEPARENQAIDSENKYRKEHNLPLRPKEDWEDDE